MALGTYLGGLVANWIVRRRRERRPAEQVECGFRVVSGELPGLTGGWRHGLATLSAGQIDFVGMVGVRLFKRKPVRIKVESIGTVDRVPRGLEVFRVSSDCVVKQLTTPGAVVEWAVLYYDVPKALSHLQPQSRKAGFQRWPDE